MHTCVVQIKGPGFVLRVRSSWACACMYVQYNTIHTYIHTYYIHIYNTDMVTLYVHTCWFYLCTDISSVHAGQDFVVRIGMCACVLHVVCLTYGWPTQGKEKKKKKVIYSQSEREIELNYSCFFYFILFFFVSTSSGEIQVCLYIHKNKNTRHTCQTAKRVASNSVLYALAI